MTESEKEKLIEELIGDRTKFDEFIYTPIEEALTSVKKINFDKSKFPYTKKAILARHLITPNYEVRRFMAAADAIDMEPLFIEYHEDKMIYKNQWKYSLIKLPLHHGLGKKGGGKLSHHPIANFDTSHGKEIRDITLHGNHSLIDFHHQLFDCAFPNVDKNVFYDASAWYKENGGTPVNYYTSFMKIFCDGSILFDNFLIDESEIEFTKKVVLPAFIDAWNSTGIKPVIVSLEPTEIEGSMFWYCHPSESIKFINDLISGPPLIR